MLPYGIPKGYQTSKRGKKYDMTTYIHDVLLAQPKTLVNKARYMYITKELSFLL